MNNSRRLATIYMILALLGLCYLAFFFQNEQRTLWSSGEARATQIAKEFAIHQDYIVPRFNGQPLLTKPPLFHWILAGTGSLLGFTEMAVRYPCALFATATVILVFFIGQVLFSRRVGMYAACILLSSFNFVVHSRTVRIDNLLVLLTCSILFSFLLYLKKQSIPALFAAYVFSGLAILCKGPVGLLPLGIVLIYVKISSPRHQWRDLHLGKGLVLLLSVSLWWYVMLIVRMGGLAFLRQFLFEQNPLEHVGAGTSSYSPLWEYGMRIILDFFPWSFIIPFVCVIVARTARSNDTRFVLLWFMVIFIIFSLLPKKADRYILGLYPACALMLGLLWDSLHSKKPAMPAYCCLLVPGALIVLLLSLAYLLHTPIQDSIWLQNIIKPKDMFMLVSILDAIRVHSLSIIVCLSSLCVLFLLTLAAIQRNRPHAMFAFILCAVMVVHFATVRNIAPALEQRKSPLGFVQTLKNFAGHDTLCFLYGTKDHVVYYLNQPIASVDTYEDIKTKLQKEKQFVLVTQLDDFAEIEEQLTPWIQDRYNGDLGFDRFEYVAVKLRYKKETGS